MPEDRWDKFIGALLAVLIAAVVLFAVMAVAWPLRASRAALVATTRKLAAFQSLDMATT